MLFPLLSSLLPRHHPLLPNTRHTARGLTSEHLNKWPCVLQKPLSCFFLWKQAPMCVSAFHANVFSFAKPLLGCHVLVPGLRPQSILRALRAFHMTDSGPMLLCPARGLRRRPYTHRRRPKRRENPRIHDASTRGPFQVEILYVRLAPRRRTYLRVSPGVSS